jgi:putative FmdB family regulatory protein
MPTYSYECTDCGHVFEVYHSISVQPKVLCVKCSSKKTKRLLGTGAGLIFRGTGFYETDYKRANNGGGRDGNKKSPSKSSAESGSSAKKTGSGGGGSASSD